MLTVYVDNMRLAFRVGKWYGKWSNLYADSTEELLGFAKELGLVTRRGEARLIDEGLTTERIMVTEAKRREAIELGAVRIRFGGVEHRKVLRIKDKDNGFEWKTEGL
jgi:hypothetical protein